MPDNQHDRAQAFAKYDAMSTEELQQILREDASKPAGDGSDTDALLSIMEVLAKRREEQKAGKSPAEALETFKKKYYEEAENCFDSESAAVTKKKVIGSGWKRGLVAAVAAICILVVGNSITINAFGSGLWEIIAKWTQETFHFGNAGQANESSEPVKNDYNANAYSELHEILDKLGIQTKLVPKWVPAGYLGGDVRITDTPKQRVFIVKHECGKNVILIRIADYIDDYPMQIEQSDSLIEIYNSAGIDYYIFDNEGQLQAVWINGRFECFISGPLTISEIKEMIDSITEG